MGYQITADTDRGVLRICLLDLLVDDELYDLLEEMRSIPNFAQYDQIVDFSGVTEFQVTPQGTRDYAARATSNSDGYNVNPDRKIAILAPSSLHFGMARIYAAHGDAIPAQIEVFRSTEAMLSWLEK